MATKLARLHEAMGRHRADVRAWQQSSHLAAIAGEREPEGPPPAPYANAPLATRMLLDERLEVQRQRRQVLRDHAADVIAASTGCWSR